MGHEEEREEREEEEDEEEEQANNGQASVLTLYGKRQWTSHPLFIEVQSYLLFIIL